MLDPSLQLLPSKSFGDNRTSLAMYIKISPWMARSWPIQEGPLAMNLYFQLKDRTVLLGEDMYGSIGLPAVRMLDYNLGALSSPGSLPSKFSEAWNGLVSRSTTKLADVEGIFATMLNLSPKEIMKYPEDERMKSIIRSQLEIPLAMLYQPNLGKHGSWALKFPSLASGADIVFDNCGILSVTEKGLVRKNIGSTFALILKGTSPESSYITLEPKDSNIKYRIKQQVDISTLNLPSAQPEMPLEPSETASDSPETLFLLSRVGSGIRGGYQGARFLVKRDRYGVDPQFEAVVSWSSSLESNLLDLAKDGELFCEYLKETRDTSYQVLIDSGKLKGS